MAIFIIMLSIFVIALSFCGGKKNRGIFGTILALLFFPLGVIFGLTKKYK